MPLAQHERQGEPGDAGIDVDGRSPGEVDRLGLAIQPPLTDPSGESNANTQCATGKYTSVPQATVKMSQVENLARSAMAPLMRAVAMMANMAWKAANARAGVLPDTCPMSSPRPSRPAGLPMRPPMLSPKVSPYPYSTQSTPMVAIVPKLIIIMLSTLLARTMPP